MTKIHLNPHVIRTNVYGSIEETKNNLKKCINTHISIPSGFGKTNEVNEVMRGIANVQISLVGYQNWLDTLCSKYSKVTEENVARLNRINNIEIKKNERILQ